MTNLKSQASRYKIYGPFPFPFSSDVRTALNAFWSQRAQDSPAGLGEAVGVYVWTHDEGGTQLPWNVGLTDKQGFKKRFFQKERSFLKHLLEEEAESVEVFLVARLTSKGKFRKPTASDKISSNQWLETKLIGSALVANPKLKNVSKTQKQRTVVIDGYLNDPGSTSDKAAKSFRKILKVD